MNGKLVHDIDEAEYHQMPGLSSTGAKKILKSPAHFQHYINHPQEPKAEFDVGTALHSKVLGVGAQIEVIPDEVLAANGAISTKAAKDFIEESRAVGRIPVKRVVANVVNWMAESVLANHVARDLFEQAGGHPEVSLFATDAEFGIDQRGRIDFLGDIAVDLKSTSGEASPEAFARTVASYGYDVQQAWYLDLLETITGQRPRFLFVVIETAAPYPVSVNILDEDYERMGIAKARRARELYARSYETGIWPGYPETIGIVRPPQYAIYDYIDQYQGVSA